MGKAIRMLAFILITAAVLGGGGCGSDDKTITLYSGRSEALVQPIIDQFVEATGIDVAVRYGNTASTVALILEEGDATPADLVLLQDAGALGALAKEHVLANVPTEFLTRVDEKFRSREGEWVGISGRARTVIYNTESVTTGDLPASVLDFVDDEWKRRIGWAPTNGSFQAFVTALRIAQGDDAAKAWLEGIKANDPTDYPNNTSIVDAVGRGEVEVGFVNHYYLLRFLAEQGEGFGARNYFPSGDIGGLMNVAGVGIIARGDTDAAEDLVDYLLQATAQTYFAQETGEYPLIIGIASRDGIPTLAELNVPDVDLSNLEDLRGTLDLMRDAGVLP
jgi:iron(III) transport system substrate-binding protein